LSRNQSGVANTSTTTPGVASASRADGGPSARNHPVFARPVAL
jgi:hypothetical protein